MNRRVAVAAALVVATATLGVLSPAKAAPTCDWPMYGHDIGHSFRATAGCSALIPANATTLAPRWVFHTSDSVSASPAVVGDTVYVGDWAGTFHAVALDSGRERWSFRVDDTNRVGFGRVTGSAAVVAVGDRSAVIFGGAATLYALDTATGAEIARACLDPRADPAVRCHGSDDTIEIESSPAVIPVAAGVWQVVVGFDVHNDSGVGRTGVVSLLFNGQTLTPAWKFDPETGATYTGPDLLTIGAGEGDGCGGVWGSPAVDVARDLVVFGTASCSVNGVTTGETVWAVSLSSGILRWSYGPPRQSTRWDDDFGASPNVLPDGRVGIGSKDGWYYCLDEATGVLVWSTHVGQAGHLFTDFAVGGIIGTPATGTVRGEPAIFITTAISTPLGPPLDDGFALDKSLLEDPARLLSLAAVRASDGTILWRSPAARQSYGAPSFANGVVLVPTTFTFSLNAFSADTGLPLAVLPALGAPSSTPVPVGPWVVMGSGTRTTDLEFKAFGAQGLSGVLGASPLSPLSGIMAFRLLLP